MEKEERSYSTSSSIGMSPGLPLFKGNGVDHEKSRYPHCIVWTPIPMLTQVDSRHPKCLVKLLLSLDLDLDPHDVF